MAKSAQPEPIEPAIRYPASAWAPSRRGVLKAGAGSLAAASLAALLSACNGSSSGSTSSSAGAGASSATDNLVVATNLGGTTFDPEDSAVNISQFPLLYDALFDASLPPEESAAQKLLANYEPNPALATKWVADKPDNSEWTITLNTTAKSPFGNSFSSADVLWSFERNLALKWYGGIFLNLVGVTSMSQVTAPTADTIKMTLSGPVSKSYFLQVLGNFLVPIYDSTEAKKHVTSADPWAKSFFATTACGFGPYTVKSVSSDGSNAVFAANPNYYGAKPIPTVTWQQTTDTDTQLQLLLRGQAQIIDSLSPTQTASVQASSGAKVTSIATTGCIFVGFNNAQETYKDVALHQGVAYAMPYDVIVNNVYKGLATPWRSVLASFLQGSTDQYWDYDQNLTKAKSLLAPYNGKGLTLQYEAGDAALQELAVVIQSSLKAAGLSIALDAMNPTSFQTKTTDATLSMFLNSTSPLVTDSLYALQLLYPTKPTDVLIHYSNADVDAAISALAKETDATKQVEYIHAAQKQLLNDLPIVPLAQLYQHEPSAKNLTGIRGHGANFMWAKGLSFS
jgi:peptide/nickel transport system substrate-binding protein